jgi:hypothetical protein
LYEVTELGHLLWQSIRLVPGDDYQVVILDSIGDGMCLGYRVAYTIRKRRGFCNGIPSVTRRSPPAERSHGG